MKATRRRPINGLRQLDHLQIRRLAVFVHGVVLSLDPLRWGAVRVVARVGKGSLTRENDGCQAVAIPESEDTSSMPSSRVLLDQVDIAFDDERAVASAGLLLSAY
jgi:hypothetical protein